MVRPFLLAAMLFLLISPAICHAQIDCVWNAEAPQTISSFSPSTWIAGQTTTVTIVGTNLCGAWVWIGSEGSPMTGDPSITLQLISNDSSTVTIFTATPDASDPTETVTVWVHLADSSNFDPASATVQIIGCAAPTITSVAPDGWWAIGQPQSITINGSCFLTSSDAHGPSQVTLTDGANAVTLSNPSVVSSTQITATVNVTKKAPAETVTLKVTNPSGSGAPQSVTANPAPVVLPVPVITWRNKTISGDDAQNKNPSVIVGQPVELTTTPATLPGGFTISKSTWIVPGTNIKQYHEDDDDGISADETVLDTANTTFYWLYLGTGLNVTYTYCATDPNANQICTSPQAKATFKATGPTASLSTTRDFGRGTIDYLKVCNQKAKEAHMFYGDLNYLPGKCSGKYEGTPGITLTASGASGGNYVFVQVIKSDTLTWNGPTPYSCGPYEVVLDQAYPFPGVNADAPSVAYDGPGMSLPSKYTQGQRDFDATMYLLWQPDQLSSTATASIPVPIGHQEWHFAATTDQKQPIGKGKWTKPDTTAHGDEGGYQASQATDNDLYGYPYWSGVSDISSCNPE
jgi:hypothetical protein